MQEVFKKICALHLEITGTSRIWHAYDVNYEGMVWVVTPCSLETEVSKAHIITIFRVEDYVKQTELWDIVLVLSNMHGVTTHRTIFYMEEYVSKIQLH
jgi:hypothetical protein